MKSQAKDANSHQAAPPITKSAVIRGLHLIKGNEIMTFDQVLERTKAYAIGLVVGLFAAPRPEWLRLRASVQVRQGEWQTATTRST